MRSKLNATQWARIRAYCLETARADLEADKDLARRLSQIADGLEDEPIVRGRQALAQSLVDEAMRWAGRGLVA